MLDESAARTVETGAKVFGWTAVLEAAAAVGCLRLLPLVDPDRPDQEALILIPLALAVVSAGSAAVAVGCGAIAIVERRTGISFGVLLPATTSLLLLLVAASFSLR